MSNIQLYLAIGVPIAFNLLGFTLLSSRISDLRENIHRELDAFRAEVNQRFFAVEGMIEQRFADMEKILDLRVKTLEEKVK